ncbi:hypothetical protein [Candidatus Tisiphia endosymbiont of Hybos culiciformis]|uniref:hypothetical protein n=1 Tax=Candidatus Tisiphia endosymbiont of Hybos culiciformis TaxID=3139331 RepID=UPI003CCADB72
MALLPQISPKRLWQKLRRLAWVVILSNGGNLDTCFRKVNTKFVSPNSIGFTI